MHIYSSIDEEDILDAARDLEGRERLDQIKYAVPERSGKSASYPKQTEPAQQ